MKNRDYKGFVHELYDRTIHGLPIDSQLLRDMAIRYNTPLPNTKQWDEEELPKIFDDYDGPDYTERNSPISEIP